MSKYYGITHGKPTWGWYLALHRRLYCSRNIHMFDEVWTVGDPEDFTHYLSCDACDLMVEIDRISEEYVTAKRLLESEA